jgi:hypothetical protein
MKRVLRIADIIVSDLAGVIRPALLLGLVLSGGVSSIAISLLISYTVLLRPHEGLAAFLGVMSFAGAGLVEPARRVVEVVNWLSLLALVGLCVRSAAHYLSSVEQRSQRNNIVQFPTPKKTSFMGSGGGIVANM